MTIHVLRGLPGSGKSTWAKAWVAEDPENRARVNRDDIREQLYGYPYDYSRTKEDVVTAVERATAATLVAEGKDIVIDATHLRADRVKPWYALSDDVVFHDFELPLEELGDRDAERKRQGGRSVGRDVIFSMAKQYHIKAAGKLPKVPKRPATDEFAFTPYVPDENLPQAFIFDIDGTLANHGDRDPYDNTRYHEDTPHEHIVMLLRVLAFAGFDIVIATGRMEDYRQVTEEWLDRIDVLHLVEGVFMRASGDKRNDAIVKAEMFHRDIAPRWHVRGAFDDRDRVVHAWRAMGLPCFQVAPGNF